MALYDTIGRSYDTTRKADPDLTRCLSRHLNFSRGARYLDIGCGTGNYTIALQQRGAMMFGVELADTMIEKARAKKSGVTWIRGSAESIPIADRSFDGAIATVTIHHWPRLRPGFDEVYRVIKSGHFVIFTSDHSQMNGYWLNEYFPRGIAAANRQMPSVEYVSEQLARAGFVDIATEAWKVPHEIEDLFLYAGKYQPEIYLDPAVRAGISFFAQERICSAEETASGCARLKADIESGRINEVMRKYRHDLGDYLFVIATKK